MPLEFRRKVWPREREMKSIFASMRMDFTSPVEVYRKSKTKP